MKKLVLLLTLVMMLGVVGCSGDDKKEETKSTQAPSTDKSDNGDKTDESKDGEYVIDEYKGKKLSEAIDAGYDFMGYWRAGGDVTVMLSSDSYDAKVEDFVKSIEGKTVAEMRDEYDISISYFGLGDEYTFSSTIGPVTIEFELDNGASTLTKYEDESFFDLEEADEVQQDVLKNISVSSVEYSVELDAASNDFLNGQEDLEREIIEENADKLVIEKLYYEFE